MLILILLPKIKRKYQWVNPWKIKIQNLFFRNYQALYRRATVYLALGKTKNALPDLNSVLEIRPDFTQAKTKRGDLYIKQGEYDKAAIDFEKDAEKRQLIQVIHRYNITRSF